MSSTNASARRRYGTGSIIPRDGNYYGKWRVGGKQVMRQLGPIRRPGTRDGLTKTDAEAKLRKLIAEVSYVAPDARASFEEVAERYLTHIEQVMGRKRSTITDYRIMLARHLAPHFGAKGVDRIAADDVARYQVVKLQAGLAPKTVRNHMTFTHGVFAFALKRGLIATNPVAAVDRPRAANTDPDIRFLNVEQVEALLRAVPDDVLGPTDHVLYLTAAMTGLRQGELAALRWRDVDWPSGLVRVRRNFTRSEFGTPKSRRSSRSVPMHDRVAAELERHFRVSAFQADDDLALGHPLTAKPYDASRMRKRFYTAMRVAGMGDLAGQKNGITFHSLRHTFGTRMAAAGVPMRTLQEWMGHKHITTTEVYADYSHDLAGGAALIARAFPSTNPSTKLRPTQTNSDSFDPW
jgi:integrase